MMNALREYGQMLVHMQCTKPNAHTLLAAVPVGAAAAALLGPAPADGALGSFGLTTATGTVVDAEADEPAGCANDVGTMAGGMLTAGAPSCMSG